jgi:hypothetical protein
LEVREETNQKQDLPASTFGFHEGEESKSGCEVSKIMLYVWHEAVYLEIIYPKFPEVRECRKVTDGVSATPCRGEVRVGMLYTNAEPLDQWKQPEVVWPLECCFGRRIIWAPFVHWTAGNCEGVVKVGCSCDVPGITGQGATGEGPGVMNEAGNDDFYQILAIGRGCRVNKRSVEPPQRRINLALLRYQI